MKIDEALDKLYSLHKFGVKLGLDNITKLLQHLDNPERKFPSLHIAGSNGKGSVASFIASILTGKGMKVGLYTSPHFVRFNERVRINGVEIGDEYIASFMEELDNYITDFKPTFFEVTTALAFKYFAEQNIDIGVIETGLGGRLDATNTLFPIASVITTISYEHTNILGKSLKSIAEEKAGIIKEKTPLFLGLVPEEAKKVIVQKAESKKANVFPLEKFLINGGDFVRLKKNNFMFTIYKTGLRGYHQLVNAALAVLTVNLIFNINDYKLISDGLLKVKSNTGLQGRYEIYSEEPRVIFDAAHNPDGVEVFLKEFEKEENNCVERTLIFGAMKDKNISQMIEKLAPHFDNILLTTIDYERAATTVELKEVCNAKGIKTSVVKEPAEFVEKFIMTNKKECLIILGSIYILGNIKGKLLARLDI